MEDVVMALLLAVGLAVGVLLTLLIDGRVLGQQLMTATTENQRLHQKLQAANGRLTVAKAQIQNLSHDLDSTTRQIEHLTIMSQSQRDELVAVGQEKETAVNRIQELHNQLNTLRDEHQTACRRLAIAAVELKYMRRDLDKAADHSQRLIQLQTDKQLLEAKTTDLSARLDAAQIQLNAAGLKGIKQVEIVRGIGPAYARRLHEAGIHNLTDLAAQTAERVGEIVGLKTWQRADPQAWIDEAAELAAAFSDGEE